MENYSEEKTEGKFCGKGCKIARKIIAIIVALSLVAGSIYYIARFYGSGEKDSIVPAAAAFRLNQKLTAGNDITFDFPEEMDKESTEESLIIPEELEGELHWADNKTLVLSPKEKTTEGSLSRIVLERTAKTKDGKMIGQDLTYRFEFAGAPEVSARTPYPDSTDVPTDGQVSITFDRAVKPLSAIQGNDSVFQAENFNLEISPEVKGKWRWLGSSAITFDAEEDLKLATKYEVKIPEGLEVLTGDKTEEDFSYSFETIRPRVTSVNPYDYSSSAGPNSEISLTFNQEINLKSVEEKVSLTSDDKEVGIKEVKYYEHENEEGEKIINKKKAVIVPEKELNFETSYQIKLEEDVKGLEGNLGTTEEFTSSFNTVGTLEIVRGKYDYVPEIAFSNPMNEENLQGKIKISPEIEGWDEKEFSVSNWGNNEYVLSIYDEYAPSTDYTLTINKDVEDKYGQKLGEDYTLKFTTPELDPSIHVHNKGNFGVFEKDKAPIFFINALNVDTVNVTHDPLTFDEFLAYQKRERSYSSDDEILSSPFDRRSFSVKQTAEKNEWEVIEFDIEEKTGEKLSPGVYYLKVTSPEWYWENYNNEKEEQYYEQFYALTDLAITLKYSGSRALVWVVNMQDGKPAKNARINFYDLNGEIEITGKTDENGFFETDIYLPDFTYNEYSSWSPEFYVTAETENDFTFISSNWGNGLNPWNFGIGSDFWGEHDAKYKVNSYTYTERPMYRPGDTAEVKGIVRLRDKNGVLVNPGKDYSVVVTVSDPDWNEIMKETIKLNEFGSWSISVPTPVDGMLGSYDIDVKVTPDHELIDNYGGASFRMLEYRKPEYLVEVNPESDDYFFGDKIKFDVEGKYFFGAPLTDADLTWRAQNTNYYFNRYTGDGWYSFAKYTDWCWYDCEEDTELLAEGEGKLDSDGRAKVEISPDLTEEELSQIITLEADVSDPNNQLVSGRSSVPMHKSNVYVGVKSDSYVIQPNKESTIDVITLNTDGSAKENQEVTVEVYERIWNTVRKEGVDGEYYYENEVEEELLKDYKVRTSNNGEGNVKITVPKGGSFSVVAKTKDGKGREAIAETWIYAWSDTYVNFSRPNNDKIEIIADKNEYNVGDTAKLLVQSPYQGDNVKMMIAVERENVISYEVLDIKSNAQTVEIPITEDLIPNAYVSAVILKPRQGETFNENGLDTGMPAFKIGYINLPIETSRKELDVSIKTDKDRYLPGEEVTASFEVKNYEGKGVKSELSVSVVDLSLLALTGFNLPDLVNMFYSEHSLGVYTRQSMIYLMERFKPGSKGGGGGDGETKLRGEFKDTAYWNAFVTTDENGKAEVKFNLPDNLTTWKIAVVAHTEDSRFGSAEAEFLETKNVILRPVRPRFAVTEDEIKLGAIVHNYTTEKRDFEVTLEGQGFEFLGSENQRVSIDPDGSEKLIFPIKVKMVNPSELKGELKLHFTAESGDYRDEIVETIPVYPFGIKQSVATNGETAEKAIEKIYIPSEGDAPVGNINVSYAPTLATHLPEGLEYLARFPYGCAEQTASSLLPNIIASHLSNFEAFRIWDDEELKTNITEGFSKLYDYQRGDGGFGYWSGSSESSVYLSAYITYVFYQAKEAGLHVDKESLASAIDYLKNSLRDTNSDEAKYISLSRRAYVLYVLSEVGHGDESLLNNLNTQIDELPIFAKAELAIAYSNIGKTEKAKEILNDLTKYAKVSTRGTYFAEEKEHRYRMFMQDNVRTTATVLIAFLRTDPENKLLPDTARWLLSAKEGGNWGTTQNTASALLALIEYLETTGEMDADFTATLNVDQNQVTETKFNSENILTREEVIAEFVDLPREEIINIGLEKEGEGMLYYDIIMDYFYTSEEIAPAEEGLGIKREIESLRGSDPDNIQVGESYQVKLTITVPNSSYNTAVESPLPAGFEPVDTSFQTTSQIDYPEDSNSDNYGYNYWRSGNWRFSHKELRDDRVFLFAEYLPAGVYEYTYIVRATTPGKFRLRPAKVWEMYTPEIFGQTWGGWFEIKE